MQFKSTISVRTRRAVAICLVGLHVGCRSLHDQGPAPSEVISCRDKWQQGLNAAQGGNWNEAETLFSSAVETYPNDERARQYYADALWRRGAHGDAVVHMTEAVRLSGNDPILLVRLGEMYLLLKRFDEATSQASAALARQPNLAIAWALQGDILRGQGHHQAALANYHRALSIRADFPRVQFTAAQILFHQKKPQPALTMLQSLIDATSQSESPDEVVHLEGLIYKSLGRYDDASHNLSLIVQRGRASVQILYELADAELRVGRRAHARWALQQALLQNPDHEASRSLLARISDAPQRTATMPSRARN